MLVFGWNAASAGGALSADHLGRRRADAPLVQAFPAVSPGAPGSTNAWPQNLAVSPDGRRLLVPLNLADSAAVVSLETVDHGAVRGAGERELPVRRGDPARRTHRAGEQRGVGHAVGDRPGEGVKLRDITVGPPLSHPQGIVVDRAGARAYVALSALDEVVVVDLRERRVERTISVGRSAGLGTMPVALALSPNGARLFVAESGADEMAVIRLPGRQTSPRSSWTRAGRIPTAEDPQAVATVAAQGGRAAQLLYVSARGHRSRAQPRPGPCPTDPDDPIFWAFNSDRPHDRHLQPQQSGPPTFRPWSRPGRAAAAPLRRRGQAAHSRGDSARYSPRDAQQAPAGTPLRADGPIKHVFFVVRENRSYDQVLGDVGRGNGDPHLAVFGKNVTPNLHALVTRFPLLDDVFANSEASIQGHYWTAAAIVPDYVDRNWVQEYGGRGRPNDFGVYAVTFPGNGFLFNQAERQDISYFNYGEGIAGDEPSVPDRNRSAALLEQEKLVAANSDLGPVLTADGTYPSDLTIGQAFGADPANPLDGEIFDSSLPAGAPPGSYSHID